MKIITFIGLIFISSMCNAEDMQQYLSDTQDLISMEEYEEALERTIWFHENALKHERSMYGVRLSFALSYWKDLGDKYPPALKVLIEIRDNNVKDILSGTNNTEIFHDVVAINRTFDESDKTISLFKQLDNERPKYAKETWHSVKREVFEAKDYELIKKYAGDIFIEYTRAEIQFIQMLSFSSENEDEYGTDIRDSAMEMFVQKANQLLKLANALNEYEIVNKIKYRVSLIENDYAIDGILND